VPSPTAVPLNVVNPYSRSHRRFDDDDDDDVEHSKVEPIAHATRCNTPAFYAHGKNDSFVRPQHTQLLHDRHASEHKELLFIDGDHNSCRPSAFFDAVSSFLFENFLTADEQGMSEPSCGAT